jgi:hypothetical protein
VKKKRYKPPKKNQKVISTIERRKNCAKGHDNNPEKKTHATCSLKTQNPTKPNALESLSHMAR